MNTTTNGTILSGAVKLTLVNSPEFKEEYLKARNLCRALENIGVLPNSNYKCCYTLHFILNAQSSPDLEHNRKTSAIIAELTRGDFGLRVWEIH